MTPSSSWEQFIVLLTTTQRSNASNTTSGDYHQFVDPTTSIQGNSQKELKEGGGKPENRNENCVLCFHQLHQIQHKKNLQTFAPAPCIIQITKKITMHCYSTIILMDQQF
jgi:hypothetical protein